jgi:4-diphosphocytidyl-2-C-methyl-D-erythritol kinase
MRTAPGSPVPPSTVEVDSNFETARAKVNLALHVTGRRPDGYHLLDSLVVFAEAADRLEAAPRDESMVSLATAGEFAGDLDRAGPQRDNLVLRAADGLLAALPGRPMPGVRIVLTKQLPVAAGIGGGSADAAAALRLLNRLWRLGAEAEALAKIGIGLGADVPACLVSRPLRVTGIGEGLELMNGIPELPLVLVNPGVALPTRAVFRRLASPDGAPMRTVPARFNSLVEFAQWLASNRNDLSEPAEAESRVVGTVVAALASDPDCLIARMSGSGATVFGIFGSPASAERAGARIRAAQPEWWVAVTRTGGS